MTRQSPAYRTNRNLFSNHYLSNRLRETDAWTEPDTAAVRDAYEEIHALYEDCADRVDDYNEAQLERNFIRPVFEALGIPFEIEETVARVNRRPDYGFFETETAADAAFDREDFYAEAVAVADAKSWGRKLDTRGEKRREFENPSYQIHVYLEEAATSWAVLTNGRQWRLYYGPTSHRLDSYYEIDLPALLDHVAEGGEGSLAAFREFYLFFRHAAFVPEGGDCFLDDVYEQSNRFSEDLSADLQDNIYEAIRVLAEGFLDGNEDLDESDLDLIHDSSLIYLYRLIFVLYAESEERDLLPTDNDVYESEYSLNSQKEAVAENLDATETAYYAWQTRLWDQLDELFELIDQGSAALGIPPEKLQIPAYNGGLFDTDPGADASRESAFLATHEVGDSYLAQVIDLLSRQEREDGDSGAASGSAGGAGAGGGTSATRKTFVDYSSLDVRQLGSIYEGLLEYQLNRASEPQTLTDESYEPAGADDEIEVAAGEVYLTTDSGERKATGSYYTPEYVVEYIVEETLGPQVASIREELMAENVDRDGGGFAERFTEEILDLTVLDPAMGSGHFLVNAVDYLAREIIDARERQDRQAVDDDRAGEIQVTTEDGERRDINWARRQVAKQCLYGVDVNPLATELAKVSLWLRTLAAGKPLAFLDHHLKTGNSLVGSNIYEVLSNGDGGQATLDDFRAARARTLSHVEGLMSELVGIENDDLASIKQMQATYQEMQSDPLYRRLFELANVHTAERFGLDVPEGAYRTMAGAIESEDEWTEQVTGEDWFVSAQAMADEERFFHWELEFPEVFMNGDGRAGGFDAVIGNPPYAPIQRLPEESREFFSSDYETTTGNYDIYVPFIEKSMELFNSESRFGFIVPNKLYRVDYGKPLREKLSEQGLVSEVVDFGSNQVFGDTATTYTTLLLLSPMHEGSFDYTELTNDSDPRTLPDVDSSDQWLENQFTNQELSGEVWNFQPESITKIIDTAHEQSVKLGELASAIARGTSTGDDDVFQLNVEAEHGELVSCTSQVESGQVEVEADVLRSPIHSTDFEKYAFIGSGNKRVIWPYDSEYNLLTETKFRSEYPNAWEYLTRHEKELVNRADYSEWYDYSAPRSLEVHDSADIVVPLLAEGPSFSEYPSPQSDYILMASGGFSISLANDSNYSPLYVLALINTPLLFLSLQSISNVFRGGYVTCTKQYFRQLPIRSIDFELSEEERDTIVEKAMEVVRKCTDPASNHTVSRRSAVSDLVGNDETEGVVHDLLVSLVEEIMDLKQKRERCNLFLPDYLGSYADGQPLTDIGLPQPPRGAADSILQQTTEQRPKLKVGDVEVERTADTSVTIHLTARYKPEESGTHDDADPETVETDSYDYRETDPIPALKITSLSETEADLIEAFVPHAVEEAGGFADFRENATKTNSLVDRLRSLTLPRVADVEQGLDSYRRAKERADELDAKIQRTDELIDEIVYDLYDLTDEEIEIVEESVGSD